MAFSTMTAQNEAALDYFVQSPVTREMISYLAQKATSVIRCDQDPQQPTSAQLPPTPPATPPTDSAPQSATEVPLPSVEAFITSLVEQSHVQVQTLMPTLVYLSRLQAKLPPAAKGMKCTVHRIFLASLILAAKNLNDSSPKNKHWARYTTVPGFPHFGFTTSEVNLMEKQLLYLLDWDLRITNEDLYLHFERFLAPIRVKQLEKAERKLKALIKEREDAEMAAHLDQLNTRSQSRSRSLAAYGVREASSTPQSCYSSGPGRAPMHCSRPRIVYAARSTSRAPSRTPSLSPPNRSDTSSTSSSYADSLPSVSPASIAEDPSCLIPRDAQPGVKAIMYTPEYPYSYDPDVIHLPQPTLQKPPKMYIPISRPIPIHPTPSVEEKPAKKLKTSAGNLFSRFLGGGSTTSLPNYTT